MGKRGSGGGGFPSVPAILVRGFANGVGARGFENGLEVDWCGLSNPCMNCDIPELGAGGWDGIVEVEREREGGGGRGC